MSPLGSKAMTFLKRKMLLGSPKLNIHISISVLWWVFFWKARSLLISNSQSPHCQRHYSSQTLATPCVFKNSFLVKHWLMYLLINSVHHFNKPRYLYLPIPSFDQWKIICDCQPEVRQLWPKAERYLNFKLSHTASSRVSDLLSNSLKFAKFSKMIMMIKRSDREEMKCISCFYLGL